MFDEGKTITFPGGMEGGGSPALLAHQTACTYVTCTEIVIMQYFYITDVQILLFLPR